MNKEFISHVNQSHKVSVIIPAYNAASYLQATLQSVLNQNAHPGEIIVVNDGSTDNTVEIAESFKYNRIRIITQKNKGLSGARNTGIEAAKGEYVAFLDADDLWTPDKLAIQVAALELYPHPAFSFTDYQYYDSKGVWPRPSEIRRHWAFKKTVDTRNNFSKIFGYDIMTFTPDYDQILGSDILLVNPKDNVPTLCDSYFQPSSTLMRRQDAIDIGGFDKNLRMIEDYEFFLRLFKIMPAVGIMQPLLLYRLHPNQMTSKGSLIKQRFIDVTNSVITSPNNYRSADVDYLTKTVFFRYYNLGIAQARHGHMSEAIQSFENSLTSHWTLGTYFTLLGAKICQSTIGRSIFDTVRGLWKKRPGKRGV